MVDWISMDHEHNLTPFQRTQTSLSLYRLVLLSNFNRSVFKLVNIRISSTYWPYSKQVEQKMLTQDLTQSMREFKRKFTNS